MTPIENNNRALLRDELAKVAHAFRNYVADILRAVVVNVTAELRRTTPVDTGWARANWIITVGSPYAGVAGNMVGHARIGQAAIGANPGSLGALGMYRLGKPVYITNNVPYIRALNRGSSKQAPSGFVQLAMAAGIAKTMTGAVVVQTTAEDAL